MFQCWVFCHNCARLKFWIAHHCRSLCLSFSINSNSLLLSKMCDTSKMIIGLLIWEGNVYLHSFMFWLSLSSEVINEGSSCFHMKFSSLFFLFLSWVELFFYGWSWGKMGKCCFSWKLSWTQEFYPNWEALWKSPVTFIYQSVSTENR